MSVATISVETWEAVGALFDRLADLPPVQRKLNELEQPSPVRVLLERMLAAHDSTDPKLLDQTVNRVVGDLLAPRVEPLEPVDYRGRTFGAWRALELIARGGMATVLRGERADGRFKKQVAIKVLSHAEHHLERARLLDEIRILARLEHPNIARLIDGGVDNGIPFLVMEHVNGIPITDYCRVHGLNQTERVRLLIQAAEAVRFAHRLLVVHCDIKPGNILVDDDGQVKLVDFGIAGLISAGENAQTMPRSLFCSPAYCAPEQFHGAPPDTAQDIFSLGAVLYELVCGQRIRNNRAATRLLFGTSARVRPAPPSKVSGKVGRDLDAICLQALAPDPTDRYRTVNELAADLDRWLNKRPVEARTGGVGYRALRLVQRNPVSAAMTALIVLVAVAGIGAELDSRAELDQRAQELEQLADFQAEMLGTIEPEQVGARLRDDLERALSGNGAEADGVLAGINFTDLAVDSVDRAVLAPALDTVRQRFADQPEVLAALLQTLAVSYRELGRLEPAGTIQDEALALRRQHLGFGHRLTLASWREQLKLKRGMAGAHQIESEFRDLVAAHERYLGPDHIDTALAHSSLGQWLMENGQAEQAERLFNQVLTRFERKDADPQDLVAVQANLAYAIASQHRFEEAEPLYRQAIAVSEEVFGSDHPYTLTTRNNLAYALRNLDRLDEAEALYRQVHAGRARTLGERHFQTSVALNNLGAIAHIKGDLQQLEGLLVQVHENLTATLGPGHANTLTAQVNLGNVLQELGKLDQAEQLLSSALEQWLAAGLKTAQPAVRVRQALAHIQFQRDDLDGAQRLLLAAWDSAEQLDDHRLKADVAGALADLNQTIDPDGADAERWQQEALVLSSRKSPQ